MKNRLRGNEAKFIILDDPLEEVDCDEKIFKKKWFHSSLEKSNRGIIQRFHSRISDNEKIFKAEYLCKPIENEIKNIELVEKVYQLIDRKEYKSVIEKRKVMEGYCILYNISMEDLLKYMEMKK